MTEKEIQRLEFARNSVSKMCHRDIHHLVHVPVNSAVGRDGFGYARMLR